VREEGIEGVGEEGIEGVREEGIEGVRERGRKVGGAGIADCRVQTANRKGRSGSGC
jgi:hypothetical protein